MNNCLWIDDGPSLVLFSRCVVPPVTVLSPILDYGRCFLRHPYEHSVKLHNDSDLPAKYELLPQQINEDTPIVYSSPKAKVCNRITEGISLCHYKWCFIAYFVLLNFICIRVLPLSWSIEIHLYRKVCLKLFQHCKKNLYMIGRKNFLVHSKCFEIFGSWLNKTVLHPSQWPFWGNTW